MSGNLAYFVIREIIYSFLKRNRTLDENEVITSVLAELKSNKIIDSMDKTNLDFAVVYCTFDLLSALGFLSLKLDKGQKQLTWRGFPGFFEKNCGIFTKSAVPVPMSEEDQQSAIIPNIYDSFVRAFFEKMLTQPDKIVTYNDYQQIASQFLYAGIARPISLNAKIEGTGKEKETRKKAQDIYIKLLNYIGLIKITQEKSAEMSEVSYLWNSAINPILKGESQIGELEYFDQRTKNCIFESASDYLRTVPRNLEAKAGFALLKGKDWKYLMRKLYIIIGRSANPANEAESILEG